MQPQPVPAPTPTDRELIASVLAGDRAPFATLVRRHNQTLYRASRAILRDDAEAEDAVQAAWVNAYRALASFRGDATFRTWLTRIAVHEASARLRKNRRLDVVPLEEATMTATDDPARDAAAEQLGRALELEIDALPEGLRAVLVMRDVLELDTAETAECLGIQEEAVRVRLHRARHAVAAAMTATGAANVWRFDGARCDRVLAGVMAELG